MSPRKCSWPSISSVYSFHNLVPEPTPAFIAGPRMRINTVIHENFAPWPRIRCEITPKHRYAMNPNGSFSHAAKSMSSFHNLVPTIRMAKSPNSAARTATPTIRPRPRTPAKGPFFTKAPQECACTDISSLNVFHSITNNSTKCSSMPS